MTGFVGPPYDAGWMMEDSGWLMVANKQTSDRPAPQPSGTPSFVLPDSPTWSSAQSGSVTEFYIGNEFTLTEGIFLNAFRYWIPGQDAGADVEITVFHLDNRGTPDENVEVQLRWQPIPAEGWLEVPVGANVFRSGNVTEWWLGFRSIATPNNFTYQWDQKNQNGTPDNDSGEMWFQDNQTEMRFSRDDDGGTNRGAELALITPGSTIETAGRTWTVLTSSVQGNGNVFYTVSPAGQRPGEALRDFRFTYYQAGDITYDYIANHWLGTVNDPPWGTVRGLINTSHPSTGIGTPTDNAPGNDLRAVLAYVSPDWDFMAYTS